MVYKIVESTTQKSVKPLCSFRKIFMKARKERGITQYELAKRVNRVNRNTRHIAQIEKGRSEPRLSTILVLADALEMDACELVRETELEIKKG